MGPAQSLVGRRGLRLGRLDLGGQLLGAGQQRDPLVAGRLGHLLAQRFLLGTQRLEPLGGGTARLVGAQQLVHQLGGLAAHSLAGADPVGVVAKQTQVNHD